MMLPLVITFSLIIILSCNVLTVRNPVPAVVSPISTYLLVAILFITLGAEFISISLIIVYVGAISVLFLFVVTMLNVRMLESDGILSNRMFII
jgi:NADH-quinone oxidoreductase subunit J